MASSGHGGVIVTAGGSAEVGGEGHRDLEWVEPGLPSECDCTLCGPTDHIKWTLGHGKMSVSRTFGGMVAHEVGDDSVVMMVAGDQDPDMTVSTVEIYNRRRDTWSQGPSTLHRRDCCRLTAIDGINIKSTELNTHIYLYPDYVYAIGGYDNVTSKVLNTCER